MASMSATARDAYLAGLARSWAASDWPVVGSLFHVWDEPSPTREQNEIPALNTAIHAALPGAVTYATTFPVVTAPGAAPVQVVRRPRLPHLPRRRATATRTSGTAGRTTSTPGSSRPGATTAASRHRSRRTTGTTTAGSATPCCSSSAPAARRSGRTTTSTTTGGCPTSPSTGRRPTPRCSWPSTPTRRTRAGSTGPSRAGRRRPAAGRATRTRTRCRGRSAQRGRTARRRSCIRPSSQRYGLTDAAAAPVSSLRMEQIADGAELVNLATQARALRGDAYVRRVFRPVFGPALRVTDTGATWLSYNNLGLAVRLEKVRRTLVAAVETSTYGTPRARSAVAAAGVAAAARRVADELALQLVHLLVERRGRTCRRGPRRRRRRPASRRAR